MLYYRNIAYCHLWRTILTVQCFFSSFFLRGQKGTSNFLFLEPPCTSTSKNELNKDELLLKEDECFVSIYFYVAIAVAEIFRTDLKLIVCLNINAWIIFYGWALLSSFTSNFPQNLLISHLIGENLVGSDGMFGKWREF